MAVMAGRDAIGRLGCQNLIGLGLAVGPSLLLETRLEKPAAAAAAEVIGPVGGHINKVFFTHNRFNHVSHIFGNRIAKGFSNQLTGILEGKLNLSFLIPVRGGFQFTLSDPFGIQLNDGFNFKVVRDVEFFQSYQDCKEFVTSLGVEPDLTA